MEARLIHARKVRTINNEPREWRVVNPLQCGIQIDISQIPNEYQRFFTFDLSPDIGHFLAEIAGVGGPWDSWTLYAIGSMGRVYDPERRETLWYFPIVFVRKERTAEEKKRVDEGFEIIEARRVER